jgi:hypothetical protein
VVPNTPFATVSVLTQLPVVILVFVIFEWRLRQIKAPRTDKDGPAKGERDWVHENVVAPAVFTKPARHAPRASKRDTGEWRRLTPYREYITDRDGWICPPLVVPLFPR